MKWFSVGCSPGTEAQATFQKLARPKRFELLTSWFVAMRSIQLSYGRVEGRGLYTAAAQRGNRPRLLSGQ